MDILQWKPTLQNTTRLDSQENLLNMCKKCVKLQKDIRFTLVCLKRNSKRNKVFPLLKQQNTDKKTRLKEIEGGENNILRTKTGGGATLSLLRSFGLPALCERRDGVCRVRWDGSQGEGASWGRGTFESR